MHLAKASESLFQSYTAQRLQIENEKQEYLTLVSEKKIKEELANNIELQLQDALQYSVANKELYDNLKSGLNQESTLKNKIEQTRVQIDNIYKKETLYKNDADEFVRDIELTVGLPKLLESIKQEINLIIKIKSDNQQQSNSNIAPEQIEAVSKIILDYLVEHKIANKEITLTELVDIVIASSNNSASSDDYDFLDFSEAKALEGLLNIKSNNAYPSLKQQQEELNLSLNQIFGLEVQIEQMKAQITGRDYTILKAFEDNEASIKSFETQLLELNSGIKNIDKRIHQYDIQMSQDPDPKYDTLAKLKSFFEDVANKLLKVKKQQIEHKMKADLNVNLAAYKDVIDRVELSESLTNLTFKIYHKAGNEIYLNQLNTASKQIVVQVLLKALHEFGDYDPPVMIDTVMGVLDETSRATVLENYFPELSHQTLLLSSDSEIRPDKDYTKIEPFISKTYTLKRDREQQSTQIVPGYFTIPSLN
jgi:DNA sulfur modification protein DndD